MKIIGGKFKGRNLKVPKTSLRPTTSIVREALFDLIGDYIIESDFLDLFAGTGIVGIEAISRGAKRVDFVEKDPKAAKVIRENLKILSLKQNVFIMDFRKFMRVWKLQYDIIFCSPPYFEKYEEEIIKFIKKYNKLKDNGILILQIFKKINPPYNEYDFNIIDERRYGITKLLFLKHKKV